MKSINDDVKKIYGPGVRVLITALMISTTTLFFMLISGDKNNQADLKDSMRLSEIKCDSIKRVYEIRLDMKQHEVDTLKQSIIRSRDETIEYLQKFTKNQESINKSLKKLK